MYRLIALLTICFVLAPLPATAVTIPTVLVGNPGNANDPIDGDFFMSGTQNFGSVAYLYRIGTYEVTNAQYVEFLNAKAKSDPLRLYHDLMTRDESGGITQSFVNGNFTYATKSGMGNKPVNYVTWYDAIRFTNWLHNGQANGDTETGAYTIGNVNPNGEPSSAEGRVRNAGATWFLPNENEWYKAAYHQPAAQGGDVDNYWTFPTAINIVPTLATAINTFGSTRGDIANPGPNVANYDFGAFWGIYHGNLTTVGSAGPLSTSFYGTFDQGGNVFEWGEGPAEAVARTVRGGSFRSEEQDLRAQYRTWHGPRYADYSFGFRVATITTVPEPSTLALAAFGALGMLIAARRKR